MLMTNAARVLSNRWRQITTGSINRRILNALIIIGGITFVVKLATIGGEVVVAGIFGTGDNLEAFLVALLLPTFVTNIVGGSFKAALIPIYIDVCENDGQLAAQRLLSGVISLSTALLLTLIVSLALIGPDFLPILASNFGPEKLILTRNLFYLLLPIIIISGVAAFWEAVLNAMECFALTSIAPIMVPIVSIGFLLVLGSTWGVFALASGMIVGYLLQLCLLGWGLKKQGIGLWPRWYGLEPSIRRVISQYLPLIAGSTIMGSTVVVDRAMAAMLDAGSVAALNYGNRLIGLASGIGTLALGTAVLPYFSRMIAKGDWIGVRHSLRTYSWLIFLVTMSLTILIYMFSRQLVQLVFEHGRFTPDDTLLVSQVQANYVLQVPFYCISILFVRLISSLQASHILMWGTVISFIVNITLDLLLMRILGVAGIALSTTIVMIVSCGFLAMMLHRRLKSIAPADAKNA